MKKYILIPVALFVAILFLNLNNPVKNNQDTDSAKFTIPADVQEVIDNSCIGCHSSDSKNAKAKLKLKFDQLASLKVSKLVGELTDISDEVSKEKMPPKRFIKNYPDKALTPEQSALLAKWAESTAKSLSE